MAELSYETQPPTVSASDPAPLFGAMAELRCTECGYGASCRATPERCPMCGGGAWQARELRQ